MRGDLSEPTCSTPAPGSFVGINNTNYACGVDSTVTGGSQNGVDGAGQNATIGGGVVNYIVNGAYGTIAGGQQNSIHNGTGGAIVGGYTNIVTGSYGFAGGGVENTASGQEAAVAGGEVNVASGAYSAVGGGYNDKSAGEFGAVGGGESNQAPGQYAAVPGGQANAARGEGSFAAGMGSNAADNGDFVWSDVSSGATAITVTGDNEFLARARGGVTFYSSANLASGVKLAPGSGTWSSLSDRNAKTGILPVSDDDILARVAVLPISEWSYSTERGVRHVGPMAQDFYAAFDVGEDNRHITSIDEDGVALAAIKALDARDQRKDAEIRSLQRQITALATQVEAMRAARN